MSLLMCQSPDCFYATLIYSFDRDWKKIEAFIGSKTAIQVNFMYLSLFGKRHLLQQ